VILSTELQRSTREEQDKRVVARLQSALDKLEAGGKVDFAKARKDVEALGRSNVEVDGAIYLKTDGERLMTAFRIEQPSENKKWFYFLYRFEGGHLVRTD
jgi:hypothetical protein